MVLVIVDLLRVVDESPGPDGKRSKMDCWSTIPSVADSIPLTAIKIVVVVWQVVTQVKTARKWVHELVSLSGAERHGV